MGIRPLLGQAAEDDNDDGWLEVAQSLGMDLRRLKGNTAILSGDLDGHRTLVQKHRGKVGIKVKFRSGVEKFSVRSRSANLKTNRVDVATGDDEFDHKYRLLLHKKRDPTQAIEYLNLQRRAVIQRLGEVLPIEEIEEDELEVAIENPPSSAELKEAIALCVAAAKYLDEDSR